VPRLEPEEEENVLDTAVGLKGSIKTVMRTKVPVFNGTGKNIVGVLCTFQDITEQKKQRTRMLKLFVHDVPGRYSWFVTRT